ncbi:phage baseplate assembly protein V [Serratia proteamaculans]
MVNPVKPKYVVELTVDTPSQQEAAQEYAVPGGSGQAGAGQQKTQLRQLEMRYLRTEQRVNGISVATLTLSVHDNPLQDLSTSKEITSCQPGKKMTIKIADGVLFTGVITDNHLTLSPDKQELTLTLKHELIRLENVIRSRIFTDDSDEGIIRALCPPGSVSIDSAASYCMNVRHEQRIQFRCSDWQMLRYSLDTCGVWLIAEPTGVRIITPSLGAVPDHVLDARKDSPLIENAEWHFSGMDKPASLTMTCWDIETQRQISIRARQPKLGSGALDPNTGQRLNDTPWALGYGTSSSSKALGIQADSLLQSLLIKRTQGEFTVEGAANYQPGQTLSVTGYGKDFDGSGIITAIVHTVTPSRWTAKVTLGDSGLAPARLSLPDINALLPGVVADYGRDDPRDFSRICVHLNTLEKDKSRNKVWARFAMPYASDKHSFLCYPEPGDEVVVGFFDGNPDYPVIVGAMHNPQRPPALKPGRDNTLKGWDFGSLKMQLDTSKKKAVIGASATSIITVEGSQVTVKGPKIDLTK